MSIMTCEHCGRYVDTDFAPTHTIAGADIHGKLVEIEVCDMCAEELEMQKEGEEAP